MPSARQLAGPVAAVLVLATVAAWWVSSLAPGRYAVTSMGRPDTGRPQGEAAVLARLQAAEHAGPGRAAAGSAGHAARAGVMAATRGALARHLTRRGIPATVRDGPGFNQFRVDWPDDGAEVLAVIPTRDRAADPYHHRWVWDGTPPDGQDVLVRCYHGLGDTLQFARFLPALAARARSVTLECQPELLPLLRPLARVVAFEDLGMEAIYEFTVEDMPVTVAVDSQGTSVHETGPAEWKSRIAGIPVVAA